MDFIENYPKIQLTIDFEDRTVDLARENYDFAIRITPEIQNKISAIRIGTVHHCLFSSPKYLKTHSEPKTLDELRQHKLLHFGAARRAVWGFHSDKGRPQPFEFQPFLNSNSGVFLLESTIKGLGISLLPDFIASDSVAAKKLVHILPNIEVPEWGIYLIHDDGRRLNRRMRLFAEEMKNACLEGLQHSFEEFA
jgi:DNA-binding transcriptional LysR family regulator